MSSNRNATTKCQVCNKSMRADTIKRHLATHYKANAVKELTPEEVEKNREKSIVFSIASAIWEDHKLQDDLSILSFTKNEMQTKKLESIDHFDKCVNRKHYDAWIYSEGAVMPPNKEYNTDTVCPFCMVQSWREILQKAEDSLKMEKKKAEQQRVSEEKKEALLKAQAELEQHSTQMELEAQRLVEEKRQSLQKEQEELRRRLAELEVEN